MTTIGFFFEPEYCTVLRIDLIMSKFARFLNSTVQIWLEITVTTGMAKFGIGAG